MNYGEPFVKVIDPLQFKLYMKHGKKPIDFYYNPSSDRVIFIFKISDTQELYKLWNERKLK
jgi:hypothetical protein